MITMECRANAAVAVAMAAEQVEARLKNAMNFALNVEAAAVQALKEDPSNYVLKQVVAFYRGVSARAVEAAQKAKETSIDARKKAWPV
jgi:hypothetical protein